MFWIYAGTQMRVEEGFRAIADAVKLPGRKQPKVDIPQLVHSWLSNERNGRWVMILDSADDGNMFTARVEPLKIGSPWLCIYDRVEMVPSSLPHATGTWPAG